jgi:hypothetical protein
MYFILLLVAMLTKALKMQFSVRFPVSNTSDNKYPKNESSDFWFSLKTKKKSIEKSKDEIL